MNSIERSVALAVVRNQQNEVLLTFRNKNQDQGGFWEFPGGKVEPGESYKSALRRELFEETGLHVQRATSLIQFLFNYRDRSIRFHLFLVDQYAGELDMRKCPSARWCQIESLLHSSMPPANRVILDMLQLPSEYMITANIAADCIRNQVQENLNLGIRLIQLRAPSLDREEYTALAADCYRLCDQHEANLIVNCDSNWWQDIQAHGLHFNSACLRKYRTLSASTKRIPLFSVSVHDELELSLARQLRPHCVLIAPVLPTSSHPGSKYLDWSGFHALALQADCPAYALGGMQIGNLELARAHAGHGLAGISMFWRS